MDTIEMQVEPELVALARAGIKELMLRNFPQQPALRSFDEMMQRRARIDTGLAIPNDWQWCGPSGGGPL